MAVVIAIGVVIRVERRSAVEVAHRIATWRRRGDDVVAVIVEAIG
jgi:hypothetical protein